MTKAPLREVKSLCYDEKTFTIASMLAPVRRNQLLFGCLAGLLACGAPARAITSFDVVFDSSIPGTSEEATGVTGKMTFNFTKNSGNQYTLDLDIFNTSPPVGNPSGTLVGFAFNVPGKNNTPSDIKLLTYNPLNSNFGDVYGATTNGNEATVANNTVLNIATNPQPAAFSPYGSFTFCARDSGSNCVGGPANGLADGQSTKVRFTLASNLANIDTAEEVTQSFFNLFNSWNPATNPQSPQVALRFQNVTTSSGKDGKSEKVGGRPRTPSQSPGDAVPGPLPVLGAATAFGFSRKLRRRITAASRKTIAAA